MAECVCFRHQLVNSWSQKCPAATFSVKPATWISSLSTQQLCFCFIPFDSWSWGFLTVLISVLQRSISRPLIVQKGQQIWHGTISRTITSGTCKWLSLSSARFGPQHLGSALLEYGRIINCATAASIKLLAGAPNHQCRSETPANRTISIKDPSMYATKYADPEKLRGGSWGPNLSFGSYFNKYHSSQSQASVFSQHHSLNTLALFHSPASMCYFRIGPVSSDSIHCFKNLHKNIFWEKKSLPKHLLYPFAASFPTTSTSGSDAKACSSRISAVSVASLEFPPAWLDDRRRIAAGKAGILGRPGWCQCLFVSVSGDTPWVWQNKSQL